MELWVKVVLAVVALVNGLQGMDRFVQWWLTRYAGRERRRTSFEASVNGRPSLQEQIRQLKREIDQQRRSDEQLRLQRERTYEERFARIDSEMRRLHKVASDYGDELQKRIESGINRLYDRLASGSK